ncbi:MAG: hypothetical protein AAF231_06290 [Pseudomonadota bacterium]
MLDLEPFPNHAGILERLKTTLATAPLPDRLRVSGQSLADRLDAPVRLSFMGPSGIGKTTLIQALLEIHIPGLMPQSGGDGPTFALAHGPHTRGFLTFDDGTNREFSEVDLPSALQQGAVYADILLPCDRLRDIRILELVTDGSASELSVAAPRAAERSEIPIWCTHQFTQEEADIWAQVSGRVKDHAILVLTQADLLNADQMAEWIESAHGMADAGFSIIAPVAAQHAYQAQKTNTRNAARIADACGINALWREILQRIDQGRQADLEHAELFLKRFERPKGRRITKPIEVQSKVAQGIPNSQALAEGHAYLRQQAEQLLLDIEEFGPFAQGQIVERCLEVANHLFDLLADDVPATPAQILAHDAVSDAADMLLLMTLENTAGAADDAVHLILQLHREFEQAA